MRQLRQLSALLDSLPVWLQLGIAIGLVAYSLAAVYGRVDVRFGARVFSNIPPEEIQTNKFHIFQYTVVPVVVTLGYLALLAGKYMGVD